MIFPLLAALAATLATLLATAVLGLLAIGIFRRRWPGRAFWRRTLFVHAALLLLHLFVTFPAAIGALAAFGLGTRPQERAYQGPRLLADGTLAVQTWESLGAEVRDGQPAVPPAVVAAAAARAVQVPSRDGVTLRAFRIEPPKEPPVAVVVMVHGLFRSAMEVEPPAKMFHDLGCEVWTFDLRNHGGSTRWPFTAGLHESDDVLAVVQRARAQPGRADTPLVLFAVSLGTVAASLALPRVPDLAGLVLDAPIDDGPAAARRLLAFDRGDRRNWFAIREPWQSLVLGWYRQWSGADLDAVRPLAVLRDLPPDLPVLVVSAGKDDRAPPATVAALFAALPMAAGTKELLSAPSSQHGHVWLDDPAGYAAHLRALLQRLRRR